MMSFCYSNSDIMSKIESAVLLTNGKEKLKPKV